MTRSPLAGDANILKKQMIFDLGGVPVGVNRDPFDFPTSIAISWGYFSSSGGCACKPIYTRAQVEGQPAIQVLFGAYETTLRQAGFLAMGGQIVDATVVAAPRQRNTEAEKAELRAGRVPDAWKSQPAKLAQKDRDARWTIKWSKTKPSEDGAKRVDIAVPAFGYKNHVGIDRRHGLIRTWMATDAARHDGAQLPSLVSNAYTAGDV